MNKENEEKNESVDEQPEAGANQAAAEAQSPETKSSAAESSADSPENAAGADAQKAGQSDGKSGGQGRPGRGGRRNAPRVPEGTVIKDPNAPEVLEKVIEIKRITKVTKGGKKLSFSALVVVGDTMGKVGYSLSKASEVSIAIRKAMATAKKNMIKIPMRGTTIPHEIIGECSGAEVLLKPAGEGTGVIASGPVRAVCDGAGIHNILTKCHRSNNPINVVKATFDGLTRLKTAREIKS
ncbi:MAG: 30S ribosomal protein S5 [Candidatus Omnitrophica bacterium]|nr:30S ribosomal protein S5 [Candidatus Omnitrophota bacterium]